MHPESTGRGTRAKVYPTKPKTQKVGPRATELPQLRVSFSLWGMDLQFVGALWPGPEFSQVRFWSTSYVEPGMDPATFYPGCIPELT